MEERIQFVDENDNPIGAGPREEAWEKKIHHRIARVMLRDEDGNFLIQKRSSQKKSYPNLWTDAASGHVDEGESYEQAAMREMGEEIGVKTHLMLIGKFLLVELKGGNQVPVFHMSFEGRVAKDVKITMQEEEVSATKWMPLSELKHLMDTTPEDFTPAFLESIKRFY
jgi:16S rRNA (adenine1518-N6/adenine1519-N6)-dimethyltransferase